MFVYRFETSSDARVKWGSIGVSFSFRIRSLELFTLNALGRGVRWPAFCVNSLASLYAGALRQFTTGRMGWSGLCSFLFLERFCDFWVLVSFSMFLVFMVFLVWGFLGFFRFLKFIGGFALGFLFLFCFLILILVFCFCLVLVFVIL